MFGDALTSLRRATRQLTELRCKRPRRNWFFVFWVVAATTQPCSAAPANHENFAFAVVTQTASVSFHPQTVATASHRPTVATATALSNAALAPPSASTPSSAGAMISAIGRGGGVSFTLHLGDMLAADTACSDATYTQQRDELADTPTALIYVPGQNDWANCQPDRTASDSAPGSSSSGDPLERLDALRDIFYPSPDSLGRNPIRVIRQSELPAFRPYRENVRWFFNGVVFVSLNVPGDNNHFLDGGGRNGEFEDREVANRDWIARAVQDAKRRRAIGMVIFFDGDPDGPVRRGNLIARLFARQSNRDGFSSLRRDIIAAAESFPGPIAIIHGARLSREHGDGAGATIRHPAVRVVNGDSGEAWRDREGRPLHNIERLSIYPPLLNQDLARWVRIKVTPGHGTAPSALFHAEIMTSPMEASATGAPTAPAGTSTGSAPLAVPTVTVPDEANAPDGNAPDANSP